MIKSSMNIDCCDCICFLVHCFQKPRAFQGFVFPYISSTGNGNIIVDAGFERDDEMNNERVDLINDMNRKKYDWSKHVWGYQETVQPYAYSSEEDGSKEEEAGETRLEVRDLNEDRFTKLEQTVLSYQTQIGAPAYTQTHGAAPAYTPTLAAATTSTQAHGAASAYTPTPAAATTSTQAHGAAPAYTPTPAAATTSTQAPTPTPAPASTHASAPAPTTFRSRASRNKAPVPSHTVLQIGTSKFDAELASRIMGPNEWLKNYDMDAMMYLFRKKTSLRRWKPNRVAFMNCMFSNQIITAYGKFDGNRRVYKVDNNLLEYGRGELPYHGSTGSVWSVDVDCLYIPICVNQIHWISMCVNLVNRTIEVFDCGGKKNNRAVEAFAILIPRIVKAVQSSDKKKDFNVKQYTVSYVPMRSLNKSGNDCGAYSLKFIECHLLGLDFSLVNDENIQEARHKIAFDLWEAANDEALQYRMSTFKPPKRAPKKTVELF
ncbi:unnamed protein product [Brassica oleracea]